MKTRFTIWGTIIGLFCGLVFTLFLLAAMPAVQDMFRVAVVGIVFLGALGGVLGLTIASFKDDA